MIGGGYTVVYVDYLQFEIVANAKQKREGSTIE